MDHSSQHAALAGKTYFIRTFGCQMNLHDSERVAGLLDSCGSFPVASPEEADIVIFMTCCVREAADQRLYGQCSSCKSLPTPPSGKRVIAVGGQTVDLVDGSVVVDGVTLDEPYVGDEPTQSLSDLSGSAGITYPYVVPDGCVWVMGDNRTNSKDSRYFGPVSVDAVTSIAVLIYWPLPDVGHI